MNTYFVSFRKQLLRRTIRLELVIPALCRQEARQIAEKEVRELQGYHYIGAN